VGIYLAQFVQILFQVLIFAILIRALMSWFPVAQGSPFVRILDDVTEPILSPLRKVVPRLGMMDITPIVAMIGLQILQQILVSGLQSI
jgi:YggT family protein